MHVLEKGAFLGEINRLSSSGGITVSVTSYCGNDEMADCIHYHEHPNIYFVIQGGSVETRRGHQNERLAGSMAFYYAGEPHSNMRKGFPGKSVNAEIALDALSKYNITEQLVEAAVSKNIDMAFALVAIYRELQMNDVHTPGSIEILLLAALSGAEKLLTADRWPVWIKQVQEMLHDRQGENITLDELSIVAQVNPITISKHFRTYFGCTMGDYMRKLKIAKALPLVKCSCLPLTDISYECGFADQSHFTRTFKRYTGMLPNYYRSKM